MVAIEYKNLGRRLNIVYLFVLAADIRVVDIEKQFVTEFLFLEAFPAGLSCTFSGVFDSSLLVTTPVHTAKTFTPRSLNFLANSTMCGAAFLQWPQSVAQKNSTV